MSIEHAGPFQVLTEEAHEDAAELLFLPDATANDWATIFSHAEVREVPAGLALVQAGEADRALYLLIEGSLSVQIPREETAFKSIDAPSVVGELAFFDGAPRSATLTALSRRPGGADRHRRLPPPVGRGAGAGRGDADGPRPHPLAAPAHGQRRDREPARVTVRVVVLAALAALLVAAPADARSVPRGWLGVQVDGPLTEPGNALGGEYDLMAAAGAETVRTAFDWRAAQPVAGGPIDFAATDAVVAAAAARRLRVIPVVHRTPDWAAERPGDGAASAPRSDRLTFTAYLTALVGRYGPRGSLWAEQPGLPRMAIRDWQIWNEPNIPRYWTTQPFAQSVRRAAARLAPRAASGRPGPRTVLRRAAERVGGSRCADLQGAAGAACSTPPRSTRTRAGRATSSR